MRPRLSTVLTIAVLASTAVPAAAAPSYQGSITVLTAKERAAMTPSVWRPGCPVDIGQMRKVWTLHYDFTGRIRMGRIVVRRDVAPQVLQTFRRLYIAKFPVRWIVPIERFGGSDYKSIQADNTTGFNCRYVDGTKRWSKHAYGIAIDINPIENPYVTAAGTTSHPASKPYINRTPRKGMAVPGGVLVRSFAAIGWDWGGYWTGAKDYQHFSASGG